MKGQSLALFSLFSSWFLLPLPSPAQEAHSLAIGGAATAAPMGAFSLFWNPSQLGTPIGGNPPFSWTAASGFSAFDTSNIGSAILQFSPQNAIQSQQDPVQRFQQYQGTFTVRYQNGAGGVLYDQELDYSSSHNALAFFRDRDSGSIAPASTYSNLNYQQTTQQVANLIVGYATSIPLGSMTVLVGGALKYHDGLSYQQTTLSGTYSQLTPGSGYQYTKTSSTSGLGLSSDLGFNARLTDSIQVAMTLQNIQSSFNWQAQQQTFTLDGSGQDVPGPISNVTVSAPFPYATKLGLLGAPPDKNILIEGEVSWSQQQTRWRFGLEQFDPANHLAVRLGTFADQVSGQQLWAFGGGYFSNNVEIDLSFITRSLPSIQDSIALGGALSAEVRF